MVCSCMGSARTSERDDIMVKQLGAPSTLSYQNPWEFVGKIRLVNPSTRVAHSTVTGTSAVQSTVPQQSLRSLTVTSQGCLDWNTRPDQVFLYDEAAHEVAGPNVHQRRGRAPPRDHSQSPRRPISTRKPVRPPPIPNLSPPPPRHAAAAGAHCAVSPGRGGASDGGGLAGDEDGEGRGDGARRGDHLGHRRGHLVRRAEGGAPRRAPGPHQDAQDVRQLRGHLRRHRGALHRRRAARAEPAQEARLRQRGRRRVRRRRHRLRLQRKEHSVSPHRRLLPGVHVGCTGHWRQYNQSGQWQGVLCVHNREEAHSLIEAVYL